MKQRINNLWKTTDKKRGELWIIVILLTMIAVRMVNILILIAMNIFLKDGRTYNAYEIGLLGVIAILPFTFVLGMEALRYFDILDEKTNIKEKFLKSSNVLMRILKVVFKILWKIIKIFVFITFSIFEYLFSGFFPQSSSETLADRVHRDNREDAERRARKAREKADYDIKQAVKQGKYNSNTIFYDTKAKRAVASQKAANEAQKELDRLS